MTYSSGKKPLTIKSILSNIGKMMAKRNKQSKRKTNQIVVRRGGKSMKNKTNQIGCGCGSTNMVTGGVNIPVTSVPITSPRQSPVLPNTVPPIQGRGIHATGFAATGRGYVPPAPQPTYWESDLPTEMVKSCSVYTDVATVTIALKARSKMTLLMTRFPSIEWLAYLVGDRENLMVEDIVIPKQRVTSVNVYVDEPVDVPIMGVIHSHHDMGNNFSHTDDDFINANHDLSLCITNTKITGQLRVKTECGRYMLADIKVQDAIEGFESDEFLKEVDDMITPINPTYGVYNGAVGARGNVVGRGSRVVTPPANQMYGNAAGWEDFLNEEDDVWDTVAPSATTQATRELLAEVNQYRISIKGQNDVSEFYRVEFEMLSNYIDSIGGGQYEVWEAKAFEGTDNVYTEQYYRLIDEISLWSDVLTEVEKSALRDLSTELTKRCEVSDTPPIKITSGQTTIN